MDVCFNNVWRGEVWPMLWIPVLVVPLIKKGQESTFEDYREDTLMLVGYKIYAVILR